jgi:two-component system, NarL family, nitrate/nitrite response regulator NarL
MTVPRTGTARFTRTRTINTAQAIKLLVVSKIAIHRLGLIRLLASLGGVTIVGAIGSAEEALASTAADSYEVVLFDLISHNCVLDVREFIRRRPRTRAVVIGESDVGDLSPAAAACARLAQNAELKELIAAIEHAAPCQSAGEVWIPVSRLESRHGIQPNSRLSSSPSSLTTRQEEILQLIDFGFSNRLIAQHLHIEEATVKNHVHNILKKLNVPSRALAAARFRDSRDGLQR